MMSMMSLFLAGLARGIGMSTFVGDRHHIILDGMGTSYGGANVAGLPIGGLCESFGSMLVAAAVARICMQGAWHVTTFLLVGGLGTHVMNLSICRGFLFFPVYLAGLTFGMRSRNSGHADATGLAARSGNGKARTIANVIGLGHMGGWCTVWVIRALILVNPWAKGAPAVALAPAGLRYVIVILVAIAAGRAAMEVRHGSATPLDTVSPSGLSAEDAVDRGACIGALGHATLI